MIQLEGVTKVFRSGRGEVRALSDLSISIETGNFAIFTGKSGSGKTTLLNCIGGIESPDRGRIICFGIPVYSLHARELSLFQRRNIGFVFQRGNLLSYLTVAENIGFPLTLNNITGKDRARRIDELLDRIDLTSASKALPHELSGGETQRVAVARAIAHNPKMLLADEPTSSLDTATGQHIVELIRAMGRDHKCTIIMVTHDVDITKMAAQVICLKDGQITEVE